MYNINQTKGWLFHKYTVTKDGVAVAVFQNAFTAMSFATCLNHLNKKK